ncbi:TIM-barrel domain-containing protein [Streptomyces rapamycinicus]|uniref:Glycosyl hydrolase family 31 C-terminal domain-containing protein n=1 Tax=Streptomyces rapamycinicus TaxID=1226757 RepID=A0ABR6LGR2_9ACTN|nr:TIM-barrel domain-containing protein [Streptomyces rapamycinicus]MBB4781537.1 hypothetical protein [Streptomyces rapamycinicus]UTO62137.1 hypothetical protein LJB45_07325 [Streptomyces rapamycinicus]UTP30089.1 hypothetical protein LIV37_12440 [Streptomyces rapamycinicus NRRL 5491]
MSRTLRRCSAALALAAPLLGAAPAAAATGPITLATPGYELRMATDRLTLTTVRAGRTVLATAAVAFRFRIGADWHLAAARRLHRKAVLVRWAQAASLMPLMYASTSPTGVRDATSGEWVGYDRETVGLYPAAIATHDRLAPYIWDQVRNTVKTGDPIMRPLFFDFPEDERSYTVSDEWMLGPAVLAAPKLDEGATRDIFLPSGVWRDVGRGTVIHGPVTLKDCAAPLGITPAFVNLKANGAAKALKALHHAS